MSEPTTCCCLVCPCNAATDLVNSDSNICKSCIKGAHYIRRNPVARPEIVVLCGSTRFKTDFESANRRLTLDGKIVLSVGVFGHQENEPPIEWVAKVSLDELHKRKIDMADCVFVLNIGGYIGESTRSEIDYAETHGKPVDYLESAKVGGRE